MWNSGGRVTVIAVDLAVTVPELSVTEVSQRQMGLLFWFADSY